MADTTTTLATYLHNALQRIRHLDLNELGDIPFDLDAEAAFNLICERNLIIHGFDVTFSTGRTFAIGFGSAIFEGYTLKDTGTPGASVTLEEETSGDPRIDVVYIAGLSVGPDTSATRVVMSSIVRTDVAAEAVGTGDDSTLIWDLGQAGVDPHTLIVQVDETQVGGWNYSRGTAGGGEDQIIFGTAPGAGLAITADYTWQSGGVETSSSQNTRTAQEINFSVAQGEPDPSPVAPSIPSGAIKIAEISLPASWTGTASGVTISQETDANGDPIREYMLHKHRSGDGTDHSPGVSPQAGRLFQAVRHMTQVVNGCRLQYISADTISVTPGWGVVGGVSFRNQADVTLTLQNSTPAGDGYVSATGWYYIYGEVEVTSLALPGSTIAVRHSTNPPDSLRRDSTGTTVGWFYIGAIWVDHTGVTIRPFYTHGDWVFWQAPTALTSSDGLVTTDTTGNITVTNWCPKTGRLMQARLNIDYQSTTNGHTFSYVVNSHKALTAKESPRIAATGMPYASNTANYEAQGLVRAEEDSGVRYVSCAQSTDSGATANQELFIQGFLDDYRTMNAAGGVPFY